MTALLQFTQGKRLFFNIIRLVHLCLQFEHCYMTTQIICHILVLQYSQNIRITIWYTFFLMVQILTITTLTTTTTKSSSQRLWGHRHKVTTLVSLLGKDTVGKNSLVQKESTTDWPYCEQEYSVNTETVLMRCRSTLYKWDYLLKREHFSHNLFMGCASI